jgi:hypothetical protein
LTDPLALLPLALAAGGGRIGQAGADATDDSEAQQLVAAGLTLLQRSAPLVRALSGRRSAILLPTSPAYLTALAASEGRGARRARRASSRPIASRRWTSARIMG